MSQSRQEIADGLGALYKQMTDIQLIMCALISILYRSEQQAQHKSIGNQSLSDELVDRINPETREVKR